MRSGVWWGGRGAGGQRETKGEKVSSLSTVALRCEQQEQQEHWHFYLSIEFNLCDGRAATALIFLTRIIPVCPPPSVLYTHTHTNTHPGTHRYCLLTARYSWNPRWVQMSEWWLVVWVRVRVCVCVRAVPVFCAHYTPDSCKSFLCNEHVTANNPGSKFPH